MGKRTEKFWKQRQTNWNRGLRERKSSLKITDEFISRFKKCCYCGVDLTPENAGLDHQQPLSRGGKDSFDNLILICQKDNRAKSSFNHAEYSSLLAFLDKSPWTPEMKLRLLRKMRGAWRIQ